MCDLQNVSRAGSKAQDPAAAEAFLMSLTNPWSKQACAAAGFEEVP
jgi:hypothetical protein